MYAALVRGIREGKKLDLRPAKYEMGPLRSSRWRWPGGRRWFESIIGPMDFSQAMRVLAAFARHGVDYVLVGSMAMAAQGLIRATRGMDVFVVPDPANVERLKAALREPFSDPSIEEIRSQDLAGDYPALQYVPPEGDYWIDILARLGEAFRFADLEAEVLEVEGSASGSPRPGYYRMKRDTVRPQDRLDAEMQKQRFDLEELRALVVNGTVPRSILI